MNRDYSKSKFIIKAKTPRSSGRTHQKITKSKRSYEYLHEQSLSLRRRVLLYLGVVLIIYLVYLLFYSPAYKIKQIFISGHLDTPQAEINDLIWQSINKNSWLLFPQDNYFFLNKKRLQNDFQSEFLLDELKIKKLPPDTLLIELTERAGQFIWVTNERIYLFDLDGNIFKEIPARELVNIGMPIVYDSSNSNIEINDKVLNSDLINVVSYIYQKFSEFGLPAIELDSFRVDSPKANFLRLTSKQGFEIHISTMIPVDKQINKLKRSLMEGKIDLNKIEYINLRIDNQVIYK